MTATSSLLGRPEAEWARSRPGVRRAGITRAHGRSALKRMRRRFRRQMRRYRACSVLQHARGCEDYPHREREYAGEQQDLIQDSNRHCSLPVCVPNAPQYRGWKTTAKCLDEGDWNSEVPKPVYNCRRKARSISTVTARLREISSMKPRSGKSPSGIGRCQKFLA